MERKKLFACISAACFILSLVMACMPVFGYVINANGTDYSGDMTLVSARVGWALVVIIIIILAGVLCLIPAFFKARKAKTAAVINCAAIAAILSPVVLIIAFIVKRNWLLAGGPVASFLQQTGSATEFHLAPAAWLMLFFSVCAGAFALLSAKKS